MKTNPLTISKLQDLMQNALAPEPVECRQMRRLIDEANRPLQERMGYTLDIDEPGGEWAPSIEEIEAFWDKIAPWGETEQVA